jgi:hypothetical protein
VNRFGKHAAAAFVSTLFIGYVLVFRPPVHVNVSQEAVYALGGALSGTALNFTRLRRNRR